jgi:DNA-binding protein WhiA
VSFSGEVKEELFRHHDSEIACAWAELAAILHYGGKTEQSEKGPFFIAINCENDFALRKSFTLCKKNINIGTDIIHHTLILPPDFPWKKVDRNNPVLLKENSCKRAFLRGAFLCSGSMSNPKKSYHLEFDCNSEEDAILLHELIAAFQIEAKIIERKKYHVVYLKEGSAISDLLNIMGAYVSLMNFENDRILKEVRNSVNRQVNCETANIAKTISASAKQVQDIILIRDTYGLGRLQDNLMEMAEVRLENPEATLLELGELLNPPVGKSGVNHRLRKLSDIAEGIRSR